MSELTFISVAASGWAGWALAHPEFGVSVNPITTRGADYAHRITVCPPGFENLAASLQYNSKRAYSGLKAKKVSFVKACCSDCMNRNFLCFNIISR